MDDNLFERSQIRIKEKKLRLSIMFRTKKKSSKKAAIFLTETAGKGAVSDMASNILATIRRKHQHSNLGPSQTLQKEGIEIQICLCGMDANNGNKLWAFSGEFQILPTIDIDDWKTVTVSDIAKQALSKIKATKVGKDDVKQQVVDHFKDMEPGDCMLVFPLQGYSSFKRTRAIRGSNDIKVSSMTNNNPNMEFVYIASETSSLGNIR